MSGFSFDLPMREASEFWRQKIKLGSKEFSKLQADAKTMAFAVSGIAQGSELNTVFDAMQKAIDDGESFDDFKARCADIFERRGWTGKRAWRVDNIFRTNIQTAYNVGRYQQMQRVKGHRPYWRYSAVNDSRTRPEHRAMHGKIFPADHPFWDTWYPPNGFRCRCSVDSVSAAEMKANGWHVEEADPTNTLFEPTDPVTGVKLPARQLLPDPGWNYNPGKAALGAFVPAEGTSGSVTLLSALAPPLAQLKPKGIPEGMLLPAHQRSGLSEEDYVALFLAEFGAEIGKPAAFVDVTGEQLVISEDLFMDRKEGKLKIFKADREVYLKLLADTIKDPAEIWLSLVEKNGKRRICRRYIGMYQGGEGRISGLVVFDLIGGEWLGTTAFKPGTLANVNKQRAGKLLYERK